MKVAYYDTTFLCKLIFSEEGAEQVKAHAAQVKHLVCSLHGKAEFIAASHRKLREGALTKYQCNEAVKQLHEDTKSGFIVWLPITEAHITRLGSVFQKASATTFLRAADALHLAAAAGNGFTEICSNDRHLLAAAPLFGLQGINVIG